ARVAGGLAVVVGGKVEKRHGVSPGRARRGPKGEEGGRRERASCDARECGAQTRGRASPATGIDFHTSDRGFWPSTKCAAAHALRKRRSRVVLSTGPVRSSPPAWRSSARAMEAGPKAEG